MFKALGLLVGAGLVLLAAGTIIPRPLFAPDSADGGGDVVEILVITNPIHTDIAIPATHESLQTFGFLAHSGLPMDAPGLKWLVFGWGGRAFYLETPTWADLKPAPALKALTLDRSVMHVELAGEIDRSLTNVSSFGLSRGRYDQVVRAIAASFSDPADGAILAASYGPNDRFYEAKGAFNVLVGCNTWAARVLRAAGLRTGWWNPLPQSLGLSLRLYN